MSDDDYDDYNEEEEEEERFLPDPFSGSRLTTTTKTTSSSSAASSVSWEDRELIREISDDPQRAFIVMMGLYKQLLTVSSPFQHDDAKRILSNLAKPCDSIQKENQNLIGSWNIVQEDNPNGEVLGKARFGKGGYRDGISLEEFQLGPKCTMRKIWDPIPEVDASEEELEFEIEFPFTYGDERDDHEELKEEQFVDTGTREELFRQLGTVKVETVQETDQCFICLEHPRIAFYGGIDPEDLGFDDHIDPYCNLILIRQQQQTSNNNKKHHNNKKKKGNKKQQQTNNNSSNNKKKKGNKKQQQTNNNSSNNNKSGALTTHNYQKKNTKHNKKKTKKKGGKQQLV